MVESIDKVCSHPKHSPNTVTGVLYGKKIIHICPGCKKRSVVYQAKYRGFNNNISEV